ncbi:hypothetical protein SLE2022_108920 [Rubroshorea leprosula]
MVFSSVPLYLDPPNWAQQPNQQAGATTTDPNPQLPPLPPAAAAGGGGGIGSIRPGSMAERARLAKIPQPEVALKCPRCESTNTKFCYFNNYSLSQPRHFCKTCRRYWTRGGALRNVPVGGGCRRNKRSKGNNRSKSPAVSDRSQTGSNPSSSTALASTSCTDVIGHMAPVVTPQLPLLPPLHNIGDFNCGDIVGLNFGGLQLQPPLAAASGGTSGGSVLSSGLVEQWRLQQFPFSSNNLEPLTGLYPFEGGAVEPPSYGQLRSKQLDSSAVSVPQLASVKLEEAQGVNFSRNFLGLSGTENEHQFWGAGNAWTDLSGFTSSSTSTHLL